MNILNDTLRVNMKPSADVEGSSSSDEEVMGMKDEIISTGHLSKKKWSHASREKWISAWDDQLWTMWCMIRNFRDEGGFMILDKIDGYADWCDMVWENSNHP